MNCPLCKGEGTAKPGSSGVFFCERCYGVFGVLTYREGCKLINPVVQVEPRDSKQVARYYFEHSPEPKPRVRRGFYDMLTMHTVSTPQRKTA